MNDHNIEKINILLMLLNKILNNMNKKYINDLEEFKDILRTDILTDVNKQELINSEDIIFKYYDKHKCGYHRKTDKLLINTIRNMCKEVGYKFIYRKLTKTIKCVVQSIYYYSIVKA